MKKNDSPNKSSDYVLSNDELMLLSEDHTAMEELDINSMQMQSLRSRVMAQVDESASPDISDLLTVRAGKGNWQKISDKIRKKMLFVDKENGVESYLLRIEPGAEDAPHRHSSDEHCMVLEGGISFGDLHLNAGDYHLAPKGSWHEKAYSEHGALLFIQTGIEQQSSL